MWMYRFCLKVVISGFNSIGRFFFFFKGIGFKMNCKLKGGNIFIFSISMNYVYEYLYEILIYNL